MSIHSKECESKRDFDEGIVKVDDFYGANGIKNSLNRRGQTTYAYKDTDLLSLIEIL